MTNEELTQKYVALDERVTRHTEQIKTCFNQIGEVRSIAESVHKLATSVEILAREQQLTNEKVDCLSDDMDELKAKPMANYEKVRLTIVTALHCGLCAQIPGRQIIRRDTYMQRAMVSQPMAGKTDQEIAATRERAILALKEKGFDVVNTLFTDE